MKHYLKTLIVFNILCSFANGQKTYFDTVNIAGYIVKELNKNDVLSYTKSSKKQLKSSNSFELPIDVIQRYLFLPSQEQVNSIPAILDSVNKKKLKNFFTFCPVQKPHVIFKDICSIDDYKVFECKSPELSNKQFFKIKGFKNKLFILYYIDGTWLRMKYNPKLDYLSSAFKVELIDAKKDSVDLYYLINFTDFKEMPKIRNKRIKEWK